MPVTRDSALEVARTLAAAHRARRDETAGALTARNDAMRNAFDAGATVGEIATAVGISAEAVSKALGRPQLAGATRRVAAK